MKMPLITDIQKFSLHDGPGIRTTVFLKGCPLNCPWCHNPETLNPEPEIYFYERKCTTCGLCVEVCSAGALEIIQNSDKKALLSIDRGKCTGCLECVDVCNSDALEVVGKSMEMSTLVQELIADKVFYESSGGGVTISGGEPLIYPEFVHELARILKKENTHVTVQTCCFVKWEKIEPLLDVVDLFIIDIKTMSPDKHKDYIGGSLQVILSNIERLINSKAGVRIHLPIIPEFNDSATDFETYVEYLGQFADRLAGVDLIPYHSYASGKYAQLVRNYDYIDVPDLPSHRLIPLADSLREKGICDVTVGGLD
ncbi:MAG: benzylsuccinate synthase subunit delta [Deltaproteobacteria bacterium]|nr:MAG: benzylsuccinate synthase subunit delta [Deltaproteobacteria bacterium]